MKNNSSRLADTFTSLRQLNGVNWNAMRSDSQVGEQDEQPKPVIDLLVVIYLNRVFVTARSGILSRRLDPFATGSPV
jgi:hypothetical protein